MMLNCKGLRPRAHGERCPARGVAAAAAPAAAGAAVTQAERGVFQKRKERGVLILPGLANNAADYAELAENLRQRGLAAQVVQVGRADWGRNAAALTDSNWWKGTLRPRPAVNWYLERVETALDDLKRQVDGAPITLLCHSAGGWLGRVFMLDFGTAGIDRYVTLGSPHAPPPAGADGVVDQTRGILTFCADACPGAHHPEVKYVTIAGRYIKGARLNGEGSLVAKFVGAGYQQVCGEADVWGDGIVPLPAAHLDGAVNVDLEGVFHSPLGARWLGEWYGSSNALEGWGHWIDDDWDSLKPGDYLEQAGAAAAGSASGGMQQRSSE